MDYIPSIETLIPHRGTMLLLDRVTEFEEKWAVGEYMPLRDAWYADESGNMPAWIGIELMAQSVAAHVALVKRKKNLPLKMGVLLGTRRYHSETDSFAAGVPLTIRANLILSDFSGLGAYDCSISSGETLQTIRATAVLKVYEPEDIKLFLQGSIS